MSVLKHSARALAIVSIASFVIGALLWQGSVLGRTAPGELQVEPASRALGDLPPASVVPVIFKATNRSSRPIRVVGINEVCASWGCVIAKNLPCVVPPHASADIVISLRTKIGNHAGNLEFDDEITLFSDSAIKNVIPLRVSGRVVRATAEN